MNSTALTQNPLEFTVQILHTSDDSLVGTGFVVCASGKIVTCKHVVEDAGVGCDGKLIGRFFSGKNPVSATVGIIFPKLDRREEVPTRARPIAYFPGFKDDVVLLQIVEKIPDFLSDQTIAKLGSADLSWRGRGNSFKAYGFRKIGDHDAVMATGTITVRAPVKRGFRGGIVQLTQVMFDGRKLIDRGMSGSAVLDTDRDLVVGLVYEVSAPVAWAVDASVLGIAPLAIPILEDRQPSPAASQTPIFTTSTQTASGRINAFEWNDAPKVEGYFVERANLSRALSADWNQETGRVSIVVGFGGDGKSWAVRTWVESLLIGADRPEEGFWWNFGVRPRADDFFEFAFRYFRLDKPMGTSGVRVGLKLAEELSLRRAVLVLDGLDTLQHVTGSQLGQLTNDDLRDFLQTLARSGSGTRCIITTRVPLMDLNNYPHSATHDLPPLNLAEGCTLLRKLGVHGGKGDDADMETIVERCAGHAITIAVLGAFLVEDYSGDPKRAREFFPRKLPSLPDERLAALLRSYDKRLGAAEKQFLTILAAFRHGVEQSAFSPVFRNTSVNNLPNQVLGPLTDIEITTLVDRLIRLQLLRRDADSGTYSLHAFLRSHYVKQLEALPGENLHALHRTIRDYYKLKKRPQVSYEVSLRDLAPLIEAIHHGCEARDFEQASKTFWQDVTGPKRDVLVHRLGALATDLEIVREFFPESDFHIDPLVADKEQAIWLINEVGICHMGLGYLREATKYLERASRKAEEQRLWKEAATSIANLAASRCLLGDLHKAKENALTAEEFAAHLPESAHRGKLSRRAIALQGWIVLWAGDARAAQALFEKADKESAGLDVFDWRQRAEGIRYGDALLACGEKDRARSIGENILTSARDGRSVPLESMASRLLGDLHRSEGNLESASEHYHNAVRLARATTRREILIEALLARGRQARLEGAVSQAEQDLREAVRECSENGYRPFEADSRKELGELLVSTGRSEIGSAELDKAKRVFEETGYRHTAQ